MEAKNLTKEFPSVFQYCQRQRDFISLLIDVIIVNDESDMFSCSAFPYPDIIQVMKGCC